MRKKDTYISQVKVRQDPVNQLAVEMRAKRFGLTIEEAKNPLAGSYVGRLCLQGVLTQDQYDATQKYLEVRNDYSCAKGLPSAVYDEIPSSSDDKAREKWVERATEQFCNTQKVLKEAQCLYRQHNLYAALQYLVMEDQELPHLVNALRIALNTLQKYFDPKSKW
ncbi:hypothetical protein [Bartonella henselae]|uniref:hypothetical protein n=1 Tax=Bartonella henselae TaxID=38323 RepID=UPI0007542D7E|nr:hypothetical protein [Bartonella henselae]ATP12435.1 hypothetical protein BhenCHDE101_04600 [Bartonella henselae]PNM38554.1 hypothetical protein AL470_003865 [Bartonella henselae str. Houston-1]UAK84719.1 hypothetical protein K8O99_02975 [Bartonella henselae]UJM37504.1 hypothetical protein KAE71_01240 [Bartonella henselae]UJM39058.1 hypothetical protein KAE72_01220 [Bartonella henselae]